MAFQNGDIVVWKAEFAQTAEERVCPLVVLEPADDGRCYVRPLNWDRDRQGVAAPTQMVRMDWLEGVAA